MRPIPLFLTIVCLVLTTALISEESRPSAQEDQNAKETKAPAPSDAVYLSMPEPPLDCTVTKQRLTGDGDMGYLVLVANVKNGSRVTITIDTSDHSQQARRRAAAKGYINGLAQTFAKHGFTLKSKEIPDLEKADFKTPVIARLNVVSEDGTKLYTHKKMFFTDMGFDVTVAAGTPETLKALVAWADKIKPAEAAKTEGE